MRKALGMAEESASWCLGCGGSGNVVVYPTKVVEGVVDPFIQCKASFGGGREGVLHGAEDVARSWQSK
jgi:hypothetical protein